MKCGDQGRKLLFWDVLEFVDEHRDYGICGLSCAANLLQECSEVPFQVSVVSETRFRLVIEAHFDVGKRHLEPFCKASEGPQPPDCVVLGGVHPAQAQQRQTELWCQQGWQRLVLWSFDPNGVNTSTICIGAHLVQQNGLSDAPETEQQYAFGLPAQLQPLQAHPHLLANVVPPRKLGRRASGAGCVWVDDGVDIQKLGKLVFFNNFTNFL